MAHRAHRYVSASAIKVNVMNVCVLDIDSILWDIIGLGWKGRVDGGGWMKRVDRERARGPFKTRKWDTTHVIHTMPLNTPLDTLHSQWKKGQAHTYTYIALIYDEHNKNYGFVISSRFDLISLVSIPSIPRHHHHHILFFSIRIHISGGVFWSSGSSSFSRVHVFHNDFIRLYMLSIYLSISFGSRTFADADSFIIFDGGNICLIKETKYCSYLWNMEHFRMSYRKWWNESLVAVLLLSLSGSDIRKFVRSSIKYLSSQ